jgi:hypothetical protein
MMILVVLAAVAGAAAMWAAGRQNARPHTYVDPTYGFSVVPPRLDPVEPGRSQTIVMLTSGMRPDNTMTGCLFIRVTEKPMSIEEFGLKHGPPFVEPMREGASCRKLTVSGRPALLWDCQDRGLGVGQRCLELDVFDRHRIFQLTCYSTSEDFPRMQKEFQNSLASFRLGD